MDLKLKQVLDSEGNFLYHDIVFQNGRIQVVDGAEEILNRLICNLSVYRGENFTNPDFGVDYHNNVFGRDETDTVVIDELKSAILKTRGVTGIKTFSLEREDRKVNLKVDVQTSAGEIKLVTPITI